MSPAPATTTPAAQAGKPTEAMTVKGQEGAVIWSKIKSDDLLRAQLRHCGFINKRGEPTVTDAELVITVQIAQKYGFDLMMKHLVPIDGHCFPTRDALLFKAEETKEKDGMEPEDSVLTDPLGRPAAEDPMSSASTEALATEARPPTRHEWRTWVTVHRKGHANPYRYLGRFPFWRKRVEWANGQKSFVGWEPHPYGLEMSVKCGEAAALRRAFNIAMATAEEVQGFGAMDTDVSELGGELRRATKGGAAGEPPKSRADAVAAAVGAKPKPEDGPHEEEAPSESEPEPGSAG